MSSETLVKRVVPLCAPCLSGHEWAYVKDALETNWVSYVGPHVTKFEQVLADASGAPFAVAMNSGTSALHIALIQAGIGRDDEVVMPAVTFVAPANAVRYCDAWPVFVDVRLDDWQMSLAATRAFLTSGCRRTNGGLVNDRTGRTVKAILLVHLLGGMADVDGFASLAAEMGLFLIEDAAECLGASFKGRGIAAPAGHLDPARRIVATSFNGNKIVTTGGGGALFSHDAGVAQRAKHLSTTAKADSIEFVHDAIGFNYRLTNIAAAVGVGQMEVLGNYVERKRAIAGRYASALRQASGVAQVHPEPEACRSTFWMYTVRLERPARPVVDALGTQGLTTRPLWRPMFELPALQGAMSWGDMSVTTTLAAHCISLPCSVDLTTDDQSRVIEALGQALSSPGRDRA